MKKSTASPLATEIGPASTSSLSDRLRENVFVLAVGIALAAGGTVYSIATYFADQDRKLALAQAEIKHSGTIGDLKRSLTSEIDRLNTRVSSIDRRLGDQKYLDVQNFFTAHPVGGREGVNKDLRYFEDVGFFAPDDSTRWTYEKTTELKLLQMLTGVDFSDILDQKVFDKIPTHLWYGHDDFIIDGLPIKRLFPYIMVEQLSRDIIPEIVGGVGKQLSAPDLREEVKFPVKEAISNERDTNDEKDDQETKIITRAFQADAVGMLLTSYLVTAVALTENPHISFSLRNVQKVGPVAYAQVVLKFSDLTVNSQPHIMLYMIKEFFLISDNSKILVVQTNVIANTPAFSGGYFNDVNLWLGGFYMAER